MIRLTCSQRKNKAEKTVRSKNSSDDVNTNEKQSDENGYPTHSGMDFDDGPLRRSRRGSQSSWIESPFDDARRTEYGEQDAFHDQQTEYLNDDQRTEYLNEAQTEYGYRGDEYSKDDGRTGTMSRIDDGMATALADNLKTGTDGLTVYGNTHEPDEDPFDPPIHPLPAVTRLSRHDENRDTVYGGQLAVGGSRRSSAANPFTPAVPPSRELDTRPETKVFQVESFNSRDFYGEYDGHPGPNTQLTAGPMTSDLLPWRTQQEVAAPPVPRVPMPQRPLIARAKPSFEPAREPGPSRPPPRPFMAQTPVNGGMGGYQGEIPNFR